jgi:hypothetical protein
MRLPAGKRELRARKLSMNELWGAVKERRSVLRDHREQRGDDRCWADDYLVWAMVEDAPDLPKKLPNFEETMKLCENFWKYRRTNKPDPIPPDVIRDRSGWDSDMLGMFSGELLDELAKLQRHIKAHSDTAKKRPLTVDDDKKLYSVLPEKMPADFRLPPRKDFLGTAKAPRAGCPSFWASHEFCKGDCNIHQWGPCGKSVARNI